MILKWKPYDTMEDGLSNDVEISSRPLKKHQIIYCQKNPHMTPRRFLRIQIKDVLNLINALGRDEKIGDDYNFILNPEVIYTNDCYFA